MLALTMVLVVTVLGTETVPVLSRAYPVFGTKRYNGAASGNDRDVQQQQQKKTWGTWGTPVRQPYQQFVRAQRYPMNYYEMYPAAAYRTAGEYQDDYYYPPIRESVSYPVYVPPPRTSKYEVYQAVLPYYYGERIPTSHRDFGAGYYYGYEKSAADPVEDLEEEMMQEVEREEREDAQPIGQEVLYEGESAGYGSNDAGLDDVNAAFLQNLIISQMYKDSQTMVDPYDPYPINSDYYFDEDDTAANLYQEDEDVKELKQLAKNQKHDRQQQHFQHVQSRPTEEERIASLRTENLKKYNKQLKNLTPDKTKKTEQSSSNSFGSRKPIVSATQQKKSLEDDNRRGQKEEVLMRPASPVKHPFSAPVLQMMQKSSGEPPERKREPSVYDTIKHMLDMEKSLENQQQQQYLSELGAPMKKRIVSSEDSLTRQLSVLKKIQH